MPAEAGVQIAVTEEQFPRYDPAHGTPDPPGKAKFEQTDYGHPGAIQCLGAARHRRPLQPRTEELRVICASLGAAAQVISSAPA